MVSLGSYIGNDALDYILNSGTVWVALHTSNPGVTGLLSTEVVGASYERLECEFSVPSSKTSANDTKLIWDNMPSCTVTYVAAWDAEFGGHIIAFGPMSTPESLTLGDQFVIPAGEFAISI